MIRKHFAYHAPGSLDEATAVAAAGDARCLAGGTWVVPLLTSGEIAPTVVVDLRLAGLGYVHADGDAVAIGATATYSDLAASGVVRDRLGLLASVANSITGGAQIRNQATLGGSACYAFPSSEAPAALVALGARMRLARAGSVREVAAAEFFTGAFGTVVAADEVLHEMAVPVPPWRTLFGYYKLKLCQSSWPVATAAWAIELDKGGLCRSATAVLGGVAATPLVVPVEDIVVGAVPGAEHAAEAADRAELAVEEPWSDVLADGAYRRSVAGVVAKRALLDALAGVTEA